MTGADAALLREGAACLALVLAADAAAWGYIRLMRRRARGLRRFAAWLRESAEELRVILRALSRRRCRRSRLRRRCRCTGEKIRRADVGYIEVLPCLDPCTDRLRVRAHYVGRK